MRSMRDKLHELLLPTTRLCFSVLPASCRQGGDRTRTQQPLADPPHDHALPAGRWQHAKHVIAWLSPVLVFDVADGVSERSG